jgi:hypothetical protein
MKNHYNDTVELTCLENGNSITAEVLDFTPAYMLTCSVNRQVKVYLRYNSADKRYKGNVGSLEFESTGQTN